MSGLEHILDGDAVAFGFRDWQAMEKFILKNRTLRLDYDLSPWAFMQRLRNAYGVKPAERVAREWWLVKFPDDVRTLAYDCHQHLPSTCTQILVREVLPDEI